MKNVYAIFYHRNEGKLTQIMGTDGVYRLDGRKGITNLMHNAVTRANQLRKLFPIDSYKIVSYPDGQIFNEKYERVLSFFIDCKNYEELRCLQNISDNQVREFNIQKETLEECFETYLKINETYGLEIASMDMAKKYDEWILKKY